MLPELLLAQLQLLIERLVEHGFNLLLALHELGVGLPEPKAHHGADVPEDREKGYELFIGLGSHY